MKKQYESPEFQLDRFDPSDVIALSDGQLSITEIIEMDELEGQ